MKRSALAFFAVLIGFAPSVAHTASEITEPPQAVAVRMQYLLEPGQVIGPVRIGTFCLPNGSLRWEEIRLPSEDEANKAIASIWNGREERGRIRAVVEDIRIRLCLPGLGKLIGKPKGRGVLNMRWERLADNGAALDAPVIVEVPIAIEGVDPRRSSIPILNALIDAAKIYTGKALAP